MPSDQASRRPRSIVTPWTCGLMQLQGSMMKRDLALSVEARAMDEIAVLSAYVDTINLLIIYHRAHPVILPRLIRMRHDFKARLHRAQARRDNASTFI